MAKIKTEWYVIVNPRAGSGKTMSKWIPAEEKLTRMGVPFYTVFTTHKHHATELAASAARMGYRRIMAVGGDGSLHEVFEGIVSWCWGNGVDPSDFYVAVMPIGSGNDWIKSFKVPDDPDEVVELLAAESFATQDIVRVDMADSQCSYMANIGGVGFDSHVCVRVNRQKERGMRNKRIYLNALMHTICTLRAINVSVVADGSVMFSGPCFSIAMGNGRHSGGCLKQTPLADTDDGLLDVTVIPKMKVLDILRELPYLLKGRINESDKVIYTQCRRLQIAPLDGDSADVVELDGELVGNLPLQASVSGMKINVLTGVTKR